MSSLGSSATAINGGPESRFNQRLDWFIGSDYYTANIPLHFMFFNDATGVDVEKIKQDPSYIRFDPDNYKPGDKVVLFYANESYLNYPNPEGIDKEIYKIKTVISYYNIPLKDIILIASIYQHNNTFSNIGLKIGLSVNQIILIDYYELQTFFFHKVLGCSYNSQFNPNAKKDLRFLFGKVHKPIRIIAMHQLWINGMLDNAVTGCLIEPNDVYDLASTIVKEYKVFYNVDVLKEDIIRMLLKYRGSPDNVKYIYFKKENLEVSNHCPSYPYDYKILFTDTKVSLIPETFYFFNQSTFVTEKTFKTIYNHHPFTILGTPNFLKALHRKGYKTFSSVCNEEYDFCRNDKKRLNLVIEATKQLITSTHDDIEMITQHNFSQLNENCMETIYRLNNSISKIFS